MTKSPPALSMCEPSSTEPSPAMPNARPKKDPTPKHPTALQLTVVRTANRLKMRTLYR
ncbi:hypothetical protein JOC55_001725 [Paenibacillus sacheonensis]|nr:hypothetical protein [Paenibacillus sacheonensis]